MSDQEKLTSNDFIWINEAYLLDQATPAAAAARRLTLFRNEIISNGRIQLSIKDVNQIISNVAQFDAWVTDNFPHLRELKLYPLSSEVRTIKAFRGEEKNPDSQYNGDSIHRLEFGTTKITRELFVSVAELASAHGYVAEEDRLGQGGSFQRKTKDVWTSFGFGILDYGEKKEVLGFSTTINFPPFEKICHPVLKESGLIGGKTGELRPSYHPPHFPFKNRIGDNFQITNIAQLKDVKPVFEKFIREDALPHFQQWAHLEKAYELALQYNEREVLSKTLGIHWEFAKATLLHMFNDPKYDSYMDAFCQKREEISQKYPDEKLAVQFYCAAIALRERLSVN